MWREFLGLLFYQSIKALFYENKRNFSLRDTEEDTDYNSIFPEVTGAWINYFR